MELNVTLKKCQHGKDKQALESEAQVKDDVEAALELTDDAHGKTDQHNQSFLVKKMEVFASCLAKHGGQTHLILHLALAAGFVAMVIAACFVNFHQALGLLVISLVTIFFLVWDWMMERYGDRVWEGLCPIRELLRGNWFWIRWMVGALLLVFVVCWLVLDTNQQGTRQLVSFSGLLLLVFLMLLFSKHPFKTFMGFTDIGSKFVFGDAYMNHFFIFRVMSILVFLISVTSILYYIGFMQWLICKIGFIMQVTMGTSPAESMVAAGNIFLGHTDAPLLIRPYISTLTVSEIHAVMTGGFASVSGTIMGAFVSIRVEAAHLLTASLLSAPASLAIAKTFWPESETTMFGSYHELRVVGQRECKNVLEAASQGACEAIGLVSNIIVNLIAFLALLGFLDAAFSWLGGMFDFPQLSFSFICSYVFMPLSFMMGVSWEDSFIVAELIGAKTFLNEFVAYQKMSELIKKRKAGGPEYVNNVKQYISVHSETIATYALCGFSNIASLGMSIGALSSLAPERRDDISSCGIRALIAGSVSCFMTACIAGMLHVPELQCPQFLSTQFSSINVTNSSHLLSCCTQLYNSVTKHELWNVTTEQEFSHSSLQGCCTHAPSEHFNCSSVQ